MRRDALLVPATLAHLREIMAWFPDQASATIWGGPQFRFPFTEAEFVEETKFASMRSFVLQGADEALLGFGQYYNRIGRCHFARLAIAPDRRGEGLGAVMIPALCKQGQQELAFAECSLFVFEHNERALHLYRRLGFVRQAYPEPAPELDERCLYMVAATGAVANFPARE